MELISLRMLILENVENVKLSAKKYSICQGARFTFVKTIQDLRKELLFRIPDCILLNTIVAEDELCALTKELRLSECTKYLPIIFLTSKGLSQDRIKGYSAGCDAYVTLPFDPEELYSIVKNLLKQKQLPTLFIMESCSLVREIQSLVLEKISSATYAGTRIFLTRQETNILKKVIEGKTIAQIQKELGTSRRNIEKYLTRLYDKSQTSGLKELKCLPWDTILIKSKVNDGT